MAIQLNERDHLIFKLIDEHQVLLEKHISWFISGDDKPVLIRDRLRKLFYLDYLLCHRHGTKLPWWTTPTKPLVYMLSPMTRAITGYPTTDIDLFSADIQRHLLEIANLRMLHLMDVKDGSITDFEWITCKADGNNRLDAKVSFKTSNGLSAKIGVINHPAVDDQLFPRLEYAVANEGVEKIFIVSRDEAHQKSLQLMLATHPVLNKRCYFSTHHELYKLGIIKTPWQQCDQQQAALFGETAHFIPAPTKLGGVSSGNAGLMPVSA